MKETNNQSTDRREEEKTRIGKSSLLALLFDRCVLFNFFFIVELLRVFFSFHSQLLIRFLLEILKDFVYFQHAFDSIHIN